MNNQNNLKSNLTKLTIFRLSAVAIMTVGTIIFTQRVGVEFTTIVLGVSTALSLVATLAPLFIHRNLFVDSQNKSKEQV